MMNKSIPVISSEKNNQQVTSKNKTGKSILPMKMKDLNSPNCLINLGRMLIPRQKCINLNRYISEETFKINTSNQKGNIKQKQESFINNEYKQHGQIIHKNIPICKKPRSCFSNIIELNNNLLKETSSTEQAEYQGLKFNYNMPSFFKRKVQKKVSHETQNISFDSFKKQDFVIIKKLGEGKFGKVFMAKQTHTGLVLAIKILQKQKILEGNLMVQFIRELKIQSFLNHPGIIKLYGIFHDKKNVYVIMQLGCDGHLFNIIEKQTLTQETASFICKTLLHSVGYMHSKNIIHRDIKPQNIVLIHGTVKLCDFGWVVDRKYQLRETFCGTPLYLSPQLLTGQPYDEKIDLWAIGILVYELCLGYSPFNIHHKRDILNIVTHEIQFPSNQNISYQFKDFIRTILRKNPQQRLSHKKLLKLKFITKYQGLQTCQELCH